MGAVDVNVSTALHMIPEIGGDDYTYAFIAGLSPTDANAKLDDEVLASIKQSVEKLHTGGARFVFIFNQPPAGCTPLYLTLFSEKSAKDEFGCLAAYNAVFQTLNVKLKAAVETYRQLWPDTIFLHYDWYAAQDEVVRNPAKYGIEVGGFRACCGGGGPYNYNPLVACGTAVLGNVCSDPEHALYWDFLHYTEAFYRVMATFALSGQFVDGPSEAVNLKAACNLDFSSFSVTIPNPPTCPSDKH
jgi:phospholipase/lecithinase/hemolysin